MGDATCPAVIVGTGFGCRIQAPALRAAGFSVAALVGTDAERTAQRARANGVPLAFTDLDRALDQTGAQLVAISTPPFTHAALTLRAIARGRHVLCEKPFARDADEAQAMLDAADAAGVVHAVGNEFRFVPARATIARALAEGMIGEPRFATFVQVSGFVAQFRDAFPDWWFDPAQGGGWLGASGSHAIDQIRAWLGEFETVSAAMGNVGLAGASVDDSFSARFRLASGVEGVLQQSCGALGGMSEITRIAGTEGSIWIGGDGGVRIADRQGERDVPIPADLALPPATIPSGDPRHDRPDWRIMADVEIAPYTALCRALRRRIAGLAPIAPTPVATFVDGVANMRVMDAIRASSADGGRVTRAV